LSIKESFPDKLSANSLATGSLIDICGFQPANQRLGELAEDYEKEMFEAIIAVPFIQNNDKRNFFTVERKHVDAVLSGPRAIASTGTGRSIVEMVEKLQKYVLPPHIDFLTNKGITPFAIYVFEFSHKFKQDELRDIWQNVMPEIAMRAEKQEVVVSHDFAPGEFFEGGSIPPETRWMIFKIKQKAAISYFDTTADTTDDARFAFRFKSGGEKIRPDYSYNWPYDFCSLVELAKVDVSVDFEAGRSAGRVPNMTEIVQTVIETEGAPYVARIASPPTPFPIAAISAVSPMEMMANLGPSLLASLAPGASTPTPAPPVQTTTAGGMATTAGMGSGLVNLGTPPAVGGIPGPTTSIPWPPRRRR